MRYLAFVAGFLAAAPAIGQELTEAEASILPRLIDSLCLDLVEGSNGCETAVLLTSEDEPDGADLVIFTDRRRSDGSAVLEVVRNIAFNGPLFGQAPWLEEAENGSLLLQSEQIGIGRSPWSQTLTIAFRDSAFVIAGFTYSTYDRLDAGGFRCDVNMLTGDWEVFGERGGEGETEAVLYSVADSGRAEIPRVRLSEWDWTAALPAPCTGPLDDWWAAGP